MNTNRPHLQLVTTERPQMLPTDVWIVDNIIKFGMAGGAVGVAGGTAAEYMQYPDELSAIADARNTVRAADRRLTTDQDAYAQVKDSPYADKAAVEQLRSQIREDKTATTAARHTLDALPNHANVLLGEGFGIGVGISMAACALKLAIEGRSRRQARHQPNGAK